MRGRHVGSLGCGLIAAAMALALLAGCSTVNFADVGTFGASQQQVADVPNIGGYTADSALAGARSHFRNNDFGYSAALYKRYAELLPKQAEGYVGLGASYDRLGRFDLSDRVYQSLYALSGGTVQYYNNVGYSYLLRGDLKQALTNFRKARQLDPGNLVVANNLQIIANATAAGRA